MPEDRVQEETIDNRTDRMQLAARAISHLFSRESQSILMVFDHESRNVEWISNFDDEVTAKRLLLAMAHQV